MSRNVKVSLTAEKKIAQLLEYLHENWSLKVKLDFVKKLDQSINIIKVDPYVFPESHKKSGLHKCVVSKQTSLFYRFNSKTIFIVTIFDNRQSPSKLKKEVK